MAEFLSPGIFIEEVPSGNQAIEAVGTSTMAIVGWTMQGPVDEATLVTSPQSFARQFGGQTHDSRVPLSISAFFTNGGTRAYVVRVVPTDAEAAESCINGTGASEPFTSGAATGSSPYTGTTTLTSLPATPGEVVISWTKAGTAVTGENPVMAPAENGVLLGPFTTTLANTLLTNDVVTLHWLEATVARTATITGTSTIGGTNAADLAAASINRNTGALSITFASGNPPDAASITVDYRPRGAAATVTDNGLGGFVDTGIAGSVDYTTGAVSITWTGGTVVPYNGNTPAAVYDGCLWAMNAISQGEWGNNVLVTLRGNDNFFTFAPATTDGAGTWSKFDLLVSVYNSESGQYEVKETFEELVFDDASDVMYAPEIVNAASDLIEMTDTGALAVPASFQGTAVTAESIGTGDGTDLIWGHTCAQLPIVQGSVVITYTDTTLKTLTADSDGNLVGADLDATKTNTINYTTGVITINFASGHAPDNATAITVSYIKAPATSSVDYEFTGGVDGTISNIGQSLVSSNALAADRRGMYALDRIDEMMQLIIPDFGGSTAVQGDMIDYAEGRRDIFAILTTPAGLSAQKAVDYVRITFARKSKYAAMYWPWIKVSDPLANNRAILLPPVAHVAGVFARTDNNKNVGKAPAGTIDGALRGLIGLERNPDKGERDTVYPARINPLINTPQTGMAVWGVRTMSSSNDAFKYINAVRLFIFVEKSVFNSTQSLVFESINSNLYSQIKTSLDSFLLNLHNQGYFAGNSPVQSFIVICDGSNNPAETVNAGQVVVDVAIAPNRPGEFIRFRFAQKTLSS